MRRSAPFFTAAALALASAAGCALPPQARPATESDVRHYVREGSRAPFSPVVRVGDVLYLSGQIGARADGTLPDSLVEQTRLAMDHIAAALAMAGAELSAVFKCTVMLDDMSRWAEFNRVYVEYFEPGRLPARSSFGADGLALGAAVEIECLAHAPPAAR